MENGADVTALDSETKFNCLDIAVENGHKYVYCLQYAVPCAVYSVLSGLFCSCPSAPLCGWLYFIFNFDDIALHCSSCLSSVADTHTALCNCFLRAN